jgi:hypothetical protein
MSLEEDRIIAGFHQELHKKGKNLDMTNISRKTFSRKET